MYLARTSRDGWQRRAAAKVAEAAAAVGVAEVVAVETAEVAAATAHCWRYLSRAAPRCCTIRASA